MAMKSSLNLPKTRDNKFRVLDKDLIVLDNNNYYQNEIFPIISTTIHQDSLIDGKELHDEFVDKIIKIHSKIKEIDSKTANEVSEYYQNGNDIFLVNSVTKNTIILPKENFSEQFKKYLYLKHNNLIDTNVLVNIKFENQIFEVGEDD